MRSFQRGEASLEALFPWPVPGVPPRDVITVGNTPAYNTTVESLGALLQFMVTSSTNSVAQASARNAQSMWKYLNDDKFWDAVSDVGVPTHCYYGSGFPFRRYIHNMLVCVFLPTNYSCLELRQRTNTTIFPTLIIFPCLKSSLLRVMGLFRSLD